jgi:capsule biosynthesis phosphatase
VRIAIDLDGTLCPIKGENEKYEDLLPLPGAVERLRELRAQGHYVIIMTARNMKTCEANVGRVMRNVGLITLSWLERHGVEYDEIHFGKPNAELYIDDRALRFGSWAAITTDLISREARQR